MHPNQQQNSKKSLSVHESKVSKDPETQTEMLSHRIQRDNLGILWDEELNEAWLENAVFVLKNLTWKYWVDETSQTSTWFSKTNILKQQQNICSITIELFHLRDACKANRTELKWNQNDYPHQVSRWKIIFQNLLFPGNILFAKAYSCSY